MRHLVVEHHQIEGLRSQHRVSRDTVMHHITDGQSFCIPSILTVTGHVAHHFFFTKIPHYNLLDATEPIKKLLEPYKNTPYGYKCETNYDFLFRYFTFNVTLDYLTHKSKGVLQYRVGVEKDRKQH